MDWFRTSLAVLAGVGGIVHIFNIKGGILDKALGAKWLTVRAVAGTATTVLAGMLLFA